MKCVSNDCVYSCCNVSRFCLHVDEDVLLAVYCIKDYVIFLFPLFASLFVLALLLTLFSVVASFAGS